MAVVAEDRIVIGKITGAFGIKGWIKIFSYTKPAEQIGNYSPWLLGKQFKSHKVSEIRSRQRSVMAKIEGVDDRNAAESLRGYQISAFIHQLDEFKEDGYYWFQLVGMRVLDQKGRELGVVERLFATGANDVMVVTDGQASYFIPYVTGQYIKQVDTDKQCILVEWQEDW